MESAAPNITSYIVTGAWFVQGLNSSTNTAMYPVRIVDPTTPLELSISVMSQKLTEEGWVYVLRQPVPNSRLNPSPKSYDLRGGKHRLVALLIDVL